MKRLLFVLILSLSSLANGDNFCSRVYDRDLALMPIPQERIESYLQKETALFKTGRFKDQEIDQSTMRSVRMIPEFTNRTHYFVSQFYHEGQFWIARIPKTGVKNVILQMARFDGPLKRTLAHIQLRFLFEEPLQLYRMEGNEMVTRELDDVVYSIQGTHPKGESYKVRDAMSGAYLVVHRLMGTVDRLEGEQLPEDVVVTQYRLRKLPRMQMNFLLENAIQFSTEKPLYRTYHAVRANCVNLTLDVIRKTLGFHLPILKTTVPRVLINGMNPIEKIMLDALDQLGLIDPSSRLPDYH